MEVAILGTASNTINWKIEPSKIATNGTSVEIALQDALLSFAARVVTSTYAMIKWLVFHLEIGLKATI
jgi:hypothetical protein